MIYSDKVKEFLEELTILSLKYNIKISGCHCCDSPYLDFVEEDETDYVYGFQLADPSKPIDWEYNHVGRIELIEQEEK